jgi:hypothetical protein
MVLDLLDGSMKPFLGSEQFVLQVIMALAVAQIASHFPESQNHPRKNEQGMKNPEHRTFIVADGCPETLFRGIEDKLILNIDHEEPEMRDFMDDLLEIADRCVNRIRPHDDQTEEVEAAVGSDVDAIVFADQQDIIGKLAKFAMKVGAVVASKSIASRTLSSSMLSPDTS